MVPVMTMRKMLEPSAAAVELTDVPLPLQLLGIILRIREKRRHMEHDFAVAERLVQRLDARLAKLRVQTSAIPGRKRGNKTRGNEDFSSFSL